MIQPFQREKGNGVAQLPSLNLASRSANGTSKNLVHKAPELGLRPTCSTQHSRTWNWTATRCAYGLAACCEHDFRRDRSRAPRLLNRRLMYRLRVSDSTGRRAGDRIGSALRVRAVGNRSPASRAASRESYGCCTSHSRHSCGDGRRAERLLGAGRRENGHRRPRSAPAADLSLASKLRTKVGKGGERVSAPAGRTCRNQPQHGLAEEPFALQFKRRPLGALRCVTCATGLDSATATSTVAACSRARKPPTSNALSTP